MSTTEEPKRLSPTRETLRELCLKSGNLCAFPGCTSLLIDQDGTFIGQVCHIEAAEPGGERFNPSMTNEDRRAAPNLMLMCYPHHQVTNDVHHYTVERLREIKLGHERRFSAPDRELRERLGRLNWKTLVGAGIVAGVVLDDLARHATAALAHDVGSHEPPRKPLRSDLEQRLRYAPRGTVFWHASDDIEHDVAKQLLDVFEAAG